MDVSDGAAEKSVMVALLPVYTDWCKIELPHLTLVYAGEIANLSPTAFNSLAKDAMTIAMLSRPITLRVMGVEVFGTDEKVDALKLQSTPELMSMRAIVEDWNASEHPFNPHCTIGPTEGFGPNPNRVYGEIPRYLVFDRVMVGWGEEQLVMWLSK
jgi:2'-5' RNA ligase